MWHVPPVRPRRRRGRAISALAGREPPLYNTPSIFNLAYDHRFNWPAKLDSLEERRNARIDEGLLRHILTNLISNAIKYSRPGGHIDIDVDATDADATFQVRDQEIGIPEGDRPRLFESFHRGIAVSSRRAGVVSHHDERALAGRDPAMIALHETVSLAAQDTISVLVLGETDVGKEVIARAIHAGSPRASRPFLALNCSALAESRLPQQSLHEEQAALEERRIREALARVGGNQTKAAKLLGISHRTLVTRLGDYDLPRPRKR